MRRYSLARNDGRVWIGGRIDPVGVSAAALRRSLREIEPDGPVRVVLDTPGGSAGEGLAIYTTLRECGRLVEVEVRQARSMGAVIAMAGHHVGIVETGIFEVHASRFDSERQGLAAFTDSPHLTAEALRRIARGLRSKAGARDEAEWTDALAAQAEAADATHLDILARRTGLDRGELARLRAAETVLDAAQAVRLGFADTIIPHQTEAAHG